MQLVAMLLTIPSILKWWRLMHTTSMLTTATLPTFKVTWMYGSKWNFLFLNLVFECFIHLTILNDMDPHLMTRTPI